MNSDRNDNVILPKLIYIQHWLVVWLLIKDFSMSSITSLSNSVINLQAIRDAGRNELEDILQSIPGEKSVVLDTSLSTPLNFITGGAKIFKVCIIYN